MYLLPPRMTRLSRRHQDTSTRALALLVAVAAFASIIAGMLAVLLDSDRQAFWLLWSGFSLFAGLSLLVSVLSCLAQARGDYIATGWAPLAMSGGLFIGALVAIRTKNPYWLLAGQLGGSALAAQWLASRLRLNWAGLRAQKVQALAALRPLRQAIVPITLGTAAFTLFQPLDAWLCLSLGDGALTTMSFAQRVLVAVSTVVSLGSYVIAAKMSRDTLRSEGVLALRKQAEREAARLVAAGLIAWVTYLVVGRTLLGWMLDSGSLHDASLDRLLTVLGSMLLGIGPMAAMPYLCRVFYTMKAFWMPAILGLAIPIGYLVISWLLLPWLGINALPVAYIAVWWLAILASLISLRRLTA